MPPNHDYGTDAEPDRVAIAEAFARLDKLAQEAEATARKVAEAEVELDLRRATHRQIIERDIPELLDQMRMTECTTSSGLRVQIERKIRASLPSGKERPADRAAAIQWLIDHGHGGLVKNKVVVALDRGEDDRADALVTQLRGAGFDPTAEKEVHPSTLSALARELLGEGRDVPMDLLGVFDQRQAKIVRR